MNNKELAGILLPEDIIEYFEVIRIEKTSESIIIELDEKNDSSKLNISEKLLSKGFYEPVTIQDFPLRGRPCYLRVRLRQWTNKNTGAIVTSDWKLTANGTRMTTEFASFLKAINR